ncbi:MAG: TolC family protein [Chitinophagaceae bacterium]|nr:MAG: TolC family protein [Chitinophagaceae bacterium]
MATMICCACTFHPLPFTRHPKSHLPNPISEIIQFYKYFCAMKIRVVIIITALLFSTNSFAQEKWNLRTVVEYAMANNLGVRQSEVQADASKLTLKQSKLGLYPAAQFSGGVSVNSGSNQDPTTFNRITQTYSAANLQLQSSADIFNFFSKRNTILANEWELKAAKANVDKLRYDIALTAANAYLQILLAKEQENIALVQIQQTSAQLLNTRRMVDAGSLPELNAAQLEAQLASDSVSYITAQGNSREAILLLKSYMNIDAATPFEVETPPASSIPVEPIADLQPESVYQLALANQPLQKANEFRLKAAEKMVKASKGAMLPTLGAFGSLGSAYNNQALQITGVIPVNTPVGNVVVGGTNYEVYPLTPFNSFTYAKAPFGTQLSDNFRQSIGLSLNVPLFNAGSLRTAYQRNKLNVTSLQLQKAQDDQKLKQDIYQAYNAAITALEKNQAALKNLTISEQTYEYATKRFEVGMLSTFDLVTTQSNLLRARLESTISLFDYVFKMKVLEFYKGMGLKL